MTAEAGGEEEEEDNIEGFLLVL